ncbi:cadherin-23-like [Physella acuta]|uniref:cadherin-23-like n=1 Tax=Physella acuta TaxID=109671 RepID=UPI0027DD8F79|nr:cadherin-23-like [Physella acuta]
MQENQPVGTYISKVSATDNDKGDEGVLQFNIIDGNQDSAFSINSDGSIITNAILDSETQNYYKLVVKISDSGLEIIRSVTSTVTVSVVDVNDHSPSCSLAYLYLEVLENTTANTLISNINCTDLDTGDTLKYYVQAPYDTVFGFSSSSSNQLRLLAPLDYDSPTQKYDIKIICSDGVNNFTITSRVKVLPVNEAAPKFSNNPSITVSENQVVQDVVLYSATDTDYSPHGVVLYKIQSVSNGGAAFFDIDPASGSIDVISALDYDILPADSKKYEVTIIAADGGGLEGTGTVTIQVANVNDNAPVCNHTIAVNVNEIQGVVPYIVLTNLGCADKEDGTSLIYSLTQSPGSHFTCLDGLVQLKNNTLDYETASLHTLVIAVKDKGTPSLSTTVTVLVSVVNQNDGGPVFTAPAPISVAENVASGSFVVAVTATDPDGNDPDFGDVRYSLVAGDPASQFSIDARSGQIYTTKTLDFETTSSYRLVIQASERAGGNSASTTQTVNVVDLNDERPLCQTGAMLVTVPENRQPSSLITQFTCTDADAGTTLVYNITTGADICRIEGNQLLLRTPLDFEKKASHDIVVHVSDMVEAHALDIAVTINVGSVDEGPPVFTNGQYSLYGVCDASNVIITMLLVREDQLILSEVGAVLAVDPDSPVDQNGQVVYSFTAPYPQFSINKSSGKILLAQSLDRETTQHFSLVVKASDAVNYTTANVEVTVLDVNDNSPQFSSNLYR